MGAGDRFERHPVRESLLWLGGLILVGLVVTAILRGFGVFTSPIKGAGDAYQQKNSAQNWVAAQRTFNQEYQDVQAFTAKIAAAKQAVTAHNAQQVPSDSLGAWQYEQQSSTLTGTVTGLEQQCANTVANYNTDARSYLTQQFRDADLPAQLDVSMCS